MSSISLLLFTNYSYIVFLTLFSSSDSSLSIFKTVVLKYFSNKSTIWSFSGMVSIDLIFPLNWPYFPFVCVCALCDILLKIRHLNYIGNPGNQILCLLQGLLMLLLFGAFVPRISLRYKVRVFSCLFWACTFPWVYTVTFYGYSIGFECPSP